MNKFFKRILVILLLQPLMPHVLHASSLKDHPSPYLNLHANDPVSWQLWDQKILDRAKAENKLIYLSIGYFSCHWCHVMQKESYQDQEIGAFLNKNYIPVKVDRELRPELDRRMIRFVEAVRGQAGWPLNVFITPEGYPVTGFTYLPRDDFLQVLDQLQEQWQQRYPEIKVLAQDYFEQTETSEERSSLVSLPDQHFDKVVEAFIGQAMMIADELQGGFGDTTKFPSYPQLNFLLQAIRITPDIDADVINFVRLTLDVMASRHLMDHVNNGFFRYVTDPDWQTPHFEKMLYDNAQLALLYLDAESLWPEQGYAQIGLGTIDFMQKFLTDETGGYNASLSAVDADNIEGAAYYWTVEELRQALNDKEFNWLKTRWLLPQDESRTIQVKSLTGLGSSAEHKKLNEAIQQKLRGVKKPSMPVDQKKLASWNALTLKALLKAESFDTDIKLVESTNKLYRFITQNFIEQGRAVRFAGKSEAAETTLTDYAQLAHALQIYSMARNDKQAEQLSGSLVHSAFDLYFQDGRWIQDTESLIPGDIGEWVLQDGVLESPVSVLLETVFLMRKPDPEIQQKALALLTRLTRDVLDVPYHYASAIMLRQQYRNKK